jgi:integrase/recombinase XerD
MNLQCLIEQYISYQRSLGSSFISDAVILRAFSRARGPRASVGNVRVEHVDAFLGKARPVTKTWFTKLSCLRGFFRFAVSRGHVSTAPLPTARPKRPLPFVPYIYTREELRHLLQVIRSHPREIGYLEPVTIRTMILLYYGSGLRLCEATNLTRSDVDLNRSILTIRNTKFGKTRLVPVGSQLNTVLVQYDRTRPKGRTAEAPFFTRRGGGPVHPVYLEQKFRFLCDCADIRRTDTLQQPRIHDLRHAFAVYRLISWYEQGLDVQRLLHHLSVYLGHVHLRHTQVYLSMTPDLLREASQRFERYAGKEQHHA